MSWAGGHPGEFQVLARGCVFDNRHASRDAKPAGRHLREKPFEPAPHEGHQMPCGDVADGPDSVFLAARNEHGLSRFAVNLPPFSQNSQSPLRITKVSSASR